MKVPFYIVNVFADGPHSGNQLAVFSHVEGLSEEEMLALAQETHFDETTFITSEPAPESGEWSARTFTPTGEVPFAGHPALGAAHVIRQENEIDKTVPLQLPAGKVQITAEGDKLWLEQLPVKFGECLDPKAVSDVLGLATGVFHESWPIQEVDVGLPFLMIPLRHLDAVRQASINRIRYNQLIMELNAKAFYIFCDQTVDANNHFHARVFGHYYGVPEDTASGSANGSLGAYLLTHSILPEPLDVRVEQGYEVGRPSLIHLRGKRVNPGFHIEVGGKVETVASGLWRVSNR